MEEHDPRRDDRTPRAIPVNIEDQMRESYMDYAMSVIIGRALPDARDGLKPVHRRILYAMFRRGWRTTGATRSAPASSARSSALPPARRSAVYDALVRLAQAWNMRYPAHRRPGQLRLRRRRSAGGLPLHGMPPHGARRGDAGGHREGDRQLRPELRRLDRRADRPADEGAEPAHQRLVRHRRRHGDEHPAAQPGRDHRG